MKIQTQFHLLIAGILIVPVLLVIAQAVYRSTERDQEALTMYKNIAAMMDDDINLENQEMFSHFLYGMSKFGDIAIFNKNFLALHSTIPRFISGTTASLEEIFVQINEQDGRYAYSFESPGFLNNGGYILIRRDTSIPRKNLLGPFLFPGIMLVSLFLFIIIFAIVMSLSIARSITKSVLVLEDATRRIAAGELDLTVDVKGSNEITSLTNSLNKMRNELKEEDLRRSRFIMGFTHDLKTPLALIKGYAEAIQDGVTGDPVSRSSAAEIITAKADQLEDMINGLIDFVRMDSGEWQGHLKEVNLKSFLKKFSAAMIPGVELLHHTMTADIALPEDLAIPMDERLLHRALENLVNNAVRYSSKGSCIRLEASLTGGDAPSERSVCLTVKDNGPGIGKADIPHIFEMFYRGTSSRREQGLGLGLSVVKWVANSHGWTIAVESQDEGENRGTCFTITMPLC